VQPTKHILDDKIREITFEGPLLLTEKDRNVDVYVFLFTDFLLFTKVKKKVRGVSHNTKYLVVKTQF